MKKWISLLFVFLLCSCSLKKEPKIYIFYSQTCPSCEVLKTSFIPQIPNSIKVELLDIDENELFYNEVLNRLENIDKSLYSQPMTPFIYFESKFAAVGYEKIMDEIYLQLIDESLNNQEYSIVPSGVWVEKGE